MLMHPPSNPEQEMLQALWQASRHFLPMLSPKVRQDYFLVLFFYKAICDEWDEAQAASTTARWMIPKEAHFATLFVQSHIKGLGHRLNLALASLEASNPASLADLFGELNFDNAPNFAPLDGDVLLHLVMNGLAQAHLSMRPGRFTQPGQVGQFFAALVEKFMHELRLPPVHCPTPIKVAQLMAQLLAPEAGHTIYDPACGSGALLAACGQVLQGRQYLLLGQDVSFDSLRLARMQLTLYGMENHLLLHGESLNVPMHGVDVDGRTVLPQVDIAISHPPEIMTRQWLTDLTQDPLQQFTFGLPTLESASLGFVLHMLACLKPETGRMAALLPRSIFSNLGNDRVILQNLLDANWIEGVICLPSWPFVHPHQPQVIMLLRRQRQTRTLCWLNASRIAQNNEETFARIEEFFFLGRDVPGYTRMLTHEDIKAGGYRWDFQP